MTILVRQVDPTNEDEITLVATRMRQTLIEVEGEAIGKTLHSMEWLLERVRWHLNTKETIAKVLLAVDSDRCILGHTIVRQEATENGKTFGLVSTTFVRPESRRDGVAEQLLDAGERWFRSQGLLSSATWTSSTNTPLIRLYKKHGYEQTATHVNETTGTTMIRLERALQGEQCGLTSRSSEAPTAGHQARLARALGILSPVTL